MDVMTAPTRVKAKMPNIRLLLDLVRDGQWAGVDYISDVKLAGGKKNVMQGRVQKVVTNARVFLGASYEKMVRRRQAEEGLTADFVPSPRTWGEYVGEYPIVRHEKNGEVKFYLQVIFDETKKPNVQYLLDGQPIEKNQIEGLPPESEGGKQGDIERKVIPRSITLTSLTEIRAAGQTIAGPFSYY